MGGRDGVSNVHPDGLSCRGAAEIVTWLMTEARRRKLNGVELKHDATIEPEHVTTLSHRT
jgi:ethanolamine ammonia-lyase small subunit